jgi:TRAP-type C4-dicarboxylate transport system permease small subunit
MFLFIWFVGVGTSATLANRADIRVTVVVERLPKRIKLVVELICLVLWGILLFTVMWYAMNMALLLFKMRSATIIMGIPLGLIYLGIVIGFFLTLLKIVLLFYTKIRQSEDPFLKTGEGSE